MKVLTDADIVSFFLSWELPPDPVEAERLLVRLGAIVDKALVNLWNKH